MLDLCPTTIAETLGLTAWARFGWVNASYVYGLSLINVHMKRALGTLTPWTTFEKATQMKAEEDDGFDTIGEEGSGDESEVDSSDEAVQGVRFK